MSKIRPFREEPTLVNKAGVALAYVLLGWIVTTHNVSAIGNLLSLFLILGIIAWALLIRRRTVKYFIRFHVTQALLLNLALAAVIWLLIALLSLLATLPVLDAIAELIFQVLFQYAPMATIPYVAAASVKDILVMSISLITAFYSLRGEYTELPYITDGVRHWV